MKAKLSDIQAKHLLPNGLQIVPFYDRIELIAAALRTVYKALIEGIVLVVAGPLFVPGQRAQRNDCDRHPDSSRH